MKNLRKQTIEIPVEYGKMVVTITEDAHHASVTATSVTDDGNAIELATVEQSVDSPEAYIYAYTGQDDGEGITVFVDGDEY